MIVLNLYYTWELFKFRVKVSSNKYGEAEERVSRIIDKTKLLHPNKTIKFKAMFPEGISSISRSRNLYEKFYGLWSMKQEKISEVSDHEGLKIYIKE